MKTKLTILTFLLLNILTYSEIRYVSPQGNNTAPFLSWATASHTIQGCINVSSPGDTIYVGNGVYKEVVTMTKGLALIGSGIDSCIIDTRELATETDFVAVTTRPYCTFEGFYLIVSNQNLGVGVLYRSSLFSGEPGFIANNKIVNASIGIWLVNLDNGYVRNNILIHSNNGYRGIRTEAFENAQAIIEGNYITVDNGINGIAAAIGGKPILRNNVIIGGKGVHSVAISGGANTLLVCNNLILNWKGYAGIVHGYFNENSINNLIIGDNENTGIWIGRNTKLINNNIQNFNSGISSQQPVNPPQDYIQFNNTWQNGVKYTNFTPDSTNISVDPMFVNEDSLDFRLQMFSPLIDAGDPEILDKDGSRSDIGLFGGPYGESYKYQDYAPKPPKNLTAEMNENEVTLNWLYNTEADFSHYRVYRDTVPNFIYDTTKIIAEVKDTTNYKDKIRAGRNVYYKITAMDNQGNQSAASEEVSVISVGVEKPKLIANDYKLFQNYPNPFNPSTMISYRLKENSRVRIVLYSTTGEKVEEIVNKHQAKGYYEINYNARKRGLSSGIYILRMEVKDENNIPRYTDAVKMILVK